MNFVLQLRNAAMIERNGLTAFQLREIADELSVAIDVLAIKRSTVAMQTLNCVWARAVKILATHTPVGSPSPPLSTILERKAA